MAQFTTSNVSTQLVGRELSIASSFVKQYYTLLNKAPCFIYNFYSHDSTFIYGTIEMANEHYTEPIVGREKIKKKMEDLNLNDCRAKIKQIDCLETLAGGLVIQVIGELSNNGRPMRRFLQTFVLAPSPDEARQDGDSQQQAKSTNNVSDNRRPTNVQSNENSNPSQNQKFFVLNSIFRYQDDAQENDIENDTAIINANTSVDNTNSANKLEIKPTTIQQHIPHTDNSQSGLKSNGSSKVATPTTTTVTGNSNAPPNFTPVTPTIDFAQNRRKQQSEVSNVDYSENLANDMDEKVKLSNKPVAESTTSESKRELGDSKLVFNGTGSLNDKKESSEKTSTENGKIGVDHSQPSILNGSNSGNPHLQQQQQQQQSKPNTTTITTSRPPPSNEPKTWANITRNAHALSAPAQTNTAKVPAEQQSQQQTLPTSQQQNTNQLTNQQQANQQQQQQQNNTNNNNNNNNNNTNNNNRRRHMMRKPSNKSAGRSMKNRPPRPPLQQQQQQQQQQSHTQTPSSTNTSNTNTTPSAPASKPVA